MGLRAAQLFEPLRRTHPPVAGVRHFEALPLPFQYFVTYWQAHSPAGGIAPIGALGRPDAPPLSTSGVVFAAEPDGAGGYEFRVERACEMFDFYYKRRVVGYSFADLFAEEEAAIQRARSTKILLARQADYLKRRRSTLPGREIVWIERIYAPFADDEGTPAYIVGLCKLSYA